MYFFLTILQEHCCSFIFYSGTVGSVFMFGSIGSLQYVYMNTAAPVAVNIQI